MATVGTSRESFELYEGTGEDWNEFALAHPGVRFCHLWQYGRVVQEAYGYRPHGFVARRDGKIVALLPALLARSLLFGRKLVSQPFSEYGGPLCSGMSDAGVAAFLGHVAEFCRERRITQLEIHGTPQIAPDVTQRSFVPANRYDHAVLELHRDPDAMRAKGFDHQVRKALNKAERNAVKGYEDHSEEMIRSRFWPLFLESMKRLGSPPHPLRYFTSLRAHFPSQLKIFWAEVEGQAVAGLLGFAVGRAVQITNIVSDERFWDLRTNDWIHWEFIRWACGEGYREFDFGSVRYEGQKRYKKKWGAVIRPSGYFYLGGMPAGAKTFSSSSKTMTSFSRLWSRYVPLQVTSFFGPAIRKQLVR